APEKKSIIVLPFENISPDPDQEYFCDGLTEEIITDLSYIHDLLVISRSSAMTFKGSKQTIKEIASKVNVQYVLEGSVRKSENNLKIIAQLIDAENDSHLWAEKYNQRLENIFGIQENVSRSIVDALKLKLTPEEEKNLVKHPIPEIDANDFYLKARYEIMRFTDEGLSRALVSLQSALDITGANARLYAEIGFAHMQYVNMGIKPEEHLELAMEYANKALNLDPDSSWGNFNKAGFALLEEGDIKKAIGFMKIALANNPNDPDLLLWGIWIYMQIGKFEVIYPMIDLAMKVDPLNPWHYMSMGGADFYSGQFISAVENCAKAYHMQPENPMSTFHYAISLAYIKRNEEAIAIVEKQLKN
ncbi:MAG: hypothetical protein KAI99_15565, partial [Cyclobacteriaceae bacterium]|nr:hypothetical protein [Cyclobacteriaceae bacterium]